MLPVTEVLAVERSEHKSEIVGLLCSGVSPARTAALMLQRYGESISLEDVVDFALQIPAENYLEPGELQRRVNFVDIEIDTIGEMAAVLRYYKDEVEVALIATRLSDGSSHITEDTRKLMNQYWNKLLKFEELRGDLDLVPVASQKAAAPAEAVLPPLRDLLYQQNLIVAPGTVLELASTPKAAKEEFVDAEVTAIDTDAEGS